MPAKPDATLEIRTAAGEFAGVDQGTACTQTSFKVGKTAFLFIGQQGGRHKAMFKLDASLPQARRLSEEKPDDFQAGNTAWVTARFSDDKPLPKRIWKKWLAESYALSAAPKKSGAKAKAAKTTASKKTAKKSTAKAATKKKATARKKTAKRK